jgi:hypothetical protein
MVVPQNLQTYNSASFLGEIDIKKKIRKNSKLFMLTFYIDKISIIKYLILQFHYRNNVSSHVVKQPQTMDVMEVIQLLRQTIFLVLEQLCQLYSLILPQTELVMQQLLQFTRPPLRFIMKGTPQADLTSEPHNQLATAQD